MAGYGESIVSTGGLFLLLVVAVVSLQSAQGTDDERVRRDDTVIKVTTKKEPPYLSDKGSGSGNDRYEGFIPELMKQIASRAKLKYELNLVKDGMYGMAKADGGWTGMIGEVIRKEADLAAASITISDGRKAVVNFSDSFMNITTTILLKRPTSGTMPFTNVNQLADQSEIKFGVVKDGMTQTFLKDSTNPTYKKMWETLQKNPKNFESDLAVGVQKVRNSNGKYAFIMESSTADYWKAQYPCDLMSVGDLGNNRAYGLVTAKNSPLLSKVNDALKALKANGELQKLRDKWWKADKVCPSAGVTMTSHVMGLVLSFVLVVLL